MVNAEEENWSSAFNRQVKAWIQDLSSKDKEFENWKTARTSVQTLGPNSRQWLVTLQVGDKHVGYMVVGEETKKSRFVLLEYGLGEFILFNDTITPKETPAQPVYDGLSSFWKISQNGLTQYIDAKTGERYPSIVAPGSRIMETLTEEEVAQSGVELTRHATFQDTETNPFDSIDWMDAKPIPTQDQKWQQQLWERKDKKTLVVAASLFQDEVFAPFTVGSIHVWGDKITYVGIWDEGLRYLPFAYISKVGKIVQ